MTGTAGGYAGYSGDEVILVPGWFAIRTGGVSLDELGAVAVGSRAGCCLDYRAGGEGGEYAVFGC